MARRGIVRLAAGEYAVVSIADGAEYSVVETAGHVFHVGDELLGEDVVLDGPGLLTTNGVSVEVFVYAMISSEREARRVLSGLTDATPTTEL